SWGARQSRPMMTTRRDIKNQTQSEQGSRTYHRWAKTRRATAWASFAALCVASGAVQAEPLRRAPQTARERVRVVPKNLRDILLRLRGNTKAPSRSPSQP